MYSEWREGRDLLSEAVSLDAVMPLHRGCVLLNLLFFFF